MCSNDINWQLISTDDSEPYNKCIHTLTWEWNMTKKEGSI